MVLGSTIRYSKEDTEGYNILLWDKTECQQEAEVAKDTQMSNLL